MSLAAVAGLGIGGAVGDNSKVGRVDWSAIAVGVWLGRERRAAYPDAGGVQRAVGTA